MAHSPEVRAKAIRDLASGKTWDVVCQKHGISKSVLKDWVDGAKKRTKSELSVSSADARQERFTKALDKFLLSTIDMVQAWAEKCSDPHFIESNPEGAHVLGRTVLERADRMVSVIESRE